MLTILIRNFFLIFSFIELLIDYFLNSLEVAAKESVPHFGPHILSRKYPKNQQFVDLLLAKCKLFLLSITSFLF